MLLATSRVLTDKGGQHGYGASGPARGTNGHPPGVRRGRHRRRRRRSLSTLQVARARLAGPDLRNRQRGRRHLVLEPLSGRALRLRKLDVRLLVLEGAARGMGVGRALFGPTPHRALSQLRRRQIRPAARHPVQQPRRRRALARGDAQLGARAGERRAPFDTLSGHRDRRSLGGRDADHSRHRQLHGPVVPHPSLAEGRHRFRRQAGRHHRHRRDRGADDPDDRQDGRSPDRLPAHPELVLAAEQQQDHPGGDARHPRPLSRDPGALPQDAELLRPRPGSAQDARGDTRGPRSLLGKALPHAGFRPMAGRISATC